MLATLRIAFPGSFFLLNHDLTEVEAHIDSIVAFAVKDLMTDVTVAEDEVSFTAVEASEAAVALSKVVGQGILVSRYGPVEESLEQTFVALAREQSLATRNGR